MSVQVVLPRAPTPRPEEGVVSWNVNTACNYRCSYCTQRFKEDRGRWATDTPRFLEGFAKLPGRWEIKLSGGEPFVHPTLDAIVTGIVGLGHRVSVVTNFSAKEERVERFVELARGRLGVFSASLHLEYVDDLDAFVAKAERIARRVRARHDAAMPAPSFCVTTVATRAVLPALAELVRRFADAGLDLKIQPEKQDRDVIAYETSERETLVQLGGHNRTGAIVHRFRELPCWAGARYFILDDRGEAFRCYPARRRRLESLGNFLDGSFRLGEAASPCLYDTCNCTVPIARKMMPFAATPPLEETSP